MATADITYHSRTDIPSDDQGIALGVWPPQVGDKDVLDFSSGTDEGAVQTEGMIACIQPDAACRVAIVDAETVATANNSRLLKADTEHALFVPTGARISLIGV